MKRQAEKEAFKKFVQPHVEAVFGPYMPVFKAWAIGKAGVECNWNTSNALIVRANNCLGIKAVPGVKKITMIANTGSETGRQTDFRVFEDLRACFIEFANMLNFRDFWDDLREE